MNNSHYKKRSDKQWKYGIASGENIDHDCGFDPIRFELVEETSELQQLVDKANEGLKAYSRLANEFEGKIERRLNSEWGRLNPHAPVEVRIKPKKTFNRFTTSNGWQVSQSLDDLHIGCMKFPLKQFTSAIAALLKDHIHDYDVSRLELSASRSGIKYQEHTLFWGDAEDIYERLKELE